MQTRNPQYFDNEIVDEARKQIANALRANRITTQKANELRKRIRLNQSDGFMLSPHRTITNANVVIRQMGHLRQMGRRFVNVKLKE